MKTCPTCNHPVEDDAKFCKSCGTQMFVSVHCPNCGEEASTEFAFCHNCGAAITGSTETSPVPDAQPASSPANAAAAAAMTEPTNTPTPAPMSEPTPYPASTPSPYPATQPIPYPAAPANAAVPSPVAPSKAKKKPLPEKTKKLFLFGGIGIVVLAAVIIIAVVLISGGKNNDRFGLYLKDGEIIYNDFSDEGAMDITTRLEHRHSSDVGSNLSKGTYIGYSIHMSDDGSRIFFPDRFDPNDNFITLYYRDIDKPEEDPIKIDSEISRYAVNEACDQVIYVKGNANVLYIHDLSDKEKIADNVGRFFFTDDFNKIAYLTYENSFYTWDEENGKTRSANDVESIEYVSEDLSLIYYIKNQTLYRQNTNDESRDKIATDVSDVMSIYDSGEVYYTKNDPTYINYMDYVDDDMAELDADITEPEYPVFPDVPEYPSWWDYDTSEEYEAAYDQYLADYEAYERASEQLTNEYYQEYEKYEAKLDRDYIRDQLNDAGEDMETVSLFYFDGTNETLITDALVYEYSSDLVSNDLNAVMILQIYNQSNIQKVKLSEVSDASEILNLVRASLTPSAENYIAVGSTLTALDPNDNPASDLASQKFRISADGSAIYFVNNFDTTSESDDYENIGDLYKIMITDGQVGSPELFDTEISLDGPMYFIGDEELAYYKNYTSDSSRGDLYIDTVEIDYEVDPSSVSYIEEDDVVVYLADFNEDQTFATLKKHENEERIKIDDDVIDYTITNDGDILYLYDYSSNFYTGSLYLHNDGENQKIDDDVEALIPLSDIKVKQYISW